MPERLRLNAEAPGAGRWPPALAVIARDAVHRAARLRPIDPDRVLPGRVVDGEALIPVRRPDVAGVVRAEGERVGGIGRVHGRDGGVVL